MDFNTLKELVKNCLLKAKSNTNHAQKEILDKIPEFIKSYLNESMTAVSLNEYNFIKGIIEEVNRDYPDQVQEKWPSLDRALSKRGSQQFIKQIKRASSFQTLKDLINQRIDINGDQSNHTVPPCDFENTDQVIQEFRALTDRFKDMLKGIDISDADDCFQAIVDYTGELVDRELFVEDVSRMNVKDAQECGQMMALYQRIDSKYGLSGCARNYLLNYLREEQGINYLDLFKNDRSAWNEIEKYIDKLTKDTGMAGHHALEVLAFCEANNVVWIGRPVNKNTVRLIKELNAAGKDVAQKPKSSNYNPIEALLATDQSLCKLAYGDERIVGLQEKADKQLKIGAEEKEKLIAAIKAESSPERKSELADEFNSRLRITGTLMQQEFDGQSCQVYMLRSGSHPIGKAVEYPLLYLFDKDGNIRLFKQGEGHNRELFGVAESLDKIKQIISDEFTSDFMNDPVIKDHLEKLKSLEDQELLVTLKNGDGNLGLDCKAVEYISYLEAILNDKQELEFSGRSVTADYDALVLGTGVQFVAEEGQNDQEIIDYNVNMALKHLESELLTVNYLTWSKPNTYDFYSGNSNQNHRVVQNVLRGLTKGFVSHADETLSPIPMEPIGEGEKHPVFFPGKQPFSVTNLDEIIDQYNIARASGYPLQINPEWCMELKDGQLIKREEGVTNPYLEPHPDVKRVNDGLADAKEKYKEDIELYTKELTTNEKEIVLDRAQQIYQAASQFRGIHDVLKVVSSPGEQVSAEDALNNLQKIYDALDKGPFHLNQTDQLQDTQDEIVNQFTIVKDDLSELIKIYERYVNEINSNSTDQAELERLTDDLKSQVSKASVSFDNFDQEANVIELAKMCLVDNFEDDSLQDALDVLIDSQYTVLMHEKKVELVRLLRRLECEGSLVFTNYEDMSDSQIKECSEKYKEKVVVYISDIKGKIDKLDHDMDLRSQGDVSALFKIESNISIELRDKQKEYMQDNRDLEHDESKEFKSAP